MDMGLISSILPPVTAALAPRVTAALAPPPTVAAPIPRVSAAQATPPTVAAPTTYSAAQTPGAVNATAATAVQDPTKGTVAGQIKGLIDANSPLMQQAETRARQEMNARGGLNSSMAIGAGQDAVINAALPIASADAGSNNQFALTNTGNQQQVNLNNADTANKVNILNTEATNASKQFGAQQTNALNTTQAQLTADTAKANAQQQNLMVINQLDQENKIQLADIQATYQNQMQANSGSSALFNSTMSAINNIQQSTTMDAATKLASTNQQVQLLKAGLSLQGSIANLNLSSVLNFAV